MVEDNGELVRLNASISRRAHSGWRAFSAEHGVTIASFLEAAGRVMGEDSERLGRSPLTRELIVEARRIAEERRHRD